MPNESWWPSFALRIIFRHIVISVAIVAGVWIVGQVVAALDHESTEFVDLVEQLLLRGVIIVLAAELFVGFVVEAVRNIIKLIHGDGFNAILAA